MRYPWKNITDLDHSPSGRMFTPRQLCAFIAPLLIALPVHAATSIQASADTFVATGSGATDRTANNYGNSGAIAVAAPTTGVGEERSILRFDVSTAKASFDATYGVGNWSITGVQLELTATTPNNPIFNQPNNTAGSILVQWLPTDNWTEGSGTPAAPTTTGLTWATLSSIAAGAESEGTIAFGGASSGTLDYGLTPGSGLTNDILSGGQITFMLSPADSSVSAVFNSRSFGTVGFRPGLVLTVAPEPGRALLLLAGVAGMMLRRRRCH